MREFPDGVVEARSPKGELFGFERTAALANRSAGYRRSRKSLRARRRHHCSRHSAGKPSSMTEPGLCVFENQTPLVDVPGKVIRAPEAGALLWSRFLTL